MMNIQPLTLEGNRIRLEPMGLDHLGGLHRAAFHEEIWRWYPSAPELTEAGIRAMIDEALEELGCIRVEFKTDSLNEKSRLALARLGAVEEGTFRNHMVTSSGRIRHSVYFSITDSEWPQVKARLESRLT